ncbi:MAG: NblA/ycf18 family protein [Geminocystis sp.]|nr:NblA/ycf18 family protein [Geminocystis sp.]HIK38197.1 NblA/ycf18 family protein [Geminocystis sp. M7585_C2015_104]MCS7148665.1 NblA/ycf18 family protein [Geminocystis sp.]MCX8078195.1 NblA/ycf18 family protein [Geminocystis sp.]MDW8115079.1 NblA/ycf18 family protein [Geminocystis sp.]
MYNFEGLSLEQQLSLRNFQMQVAKMTREQAQDFLVRLYAEMLIRENLYKDILKHKWGLEES